MENVCKKLNFIQENTDTFQMKCRIFFKRFAYAAWVMCAFFEAALYVSCSLISNLENNSQTSNKKDASACTVTVFSSEHDLADWKHLFIPADQCSNVVGGGSIGITTIKSNTIQNPEYLNIKLYNGNWEALSKGTAQGCTMQGDLFILYNVCGTFTYTLTEAEANQIRENGLIIQGYGLSITMVTFTAPELSGDGSDTNGSGTNSKPTTVPVGTPYERHGALHVKGAHLYDSKGNVMQLYGMSTHGLSWFPQYVDKQGFKTLRDEWNTNCVRLVLYPRDYNGYLTGGNKGELIQLVKNGVQYASELGMYVLVDWHVHNYNPKETQSEAIGFLEEVSKTFSQYGNVLYEICNEPTGAPWETEIKPYAQAVIPAIRKNAPDAVIVVGTNTWSQDIEGPMASPLGFSNVMYTFHFYANTHTESFRKRVESAVEKGLPVFVTEFGTCDASGNGGFNSNETELWFALLKKHSISHLNWSLCNKEETASAFITSCTKTADWSSDELTDSGKLVLEHFKTLNP